MGRLRDKGIGEAVPSRPPHDQPRDKRGQYPGGNLDPPQHDAGSRQRATAEKPTGSLDPRLSPRAQHERQDLRKSGGGDGRHDQAELAASVRKRYAELRAEQALKDVLARGAEKARAIASPTLRLVRQRMGIGSIG
jgi:hypothetical protein